MNLNAMEAKKKMSEWRRKIPTKRQLTKTFDQFVQKKSVEMLYTPSEQKRIAEMSEMITKATCEFENDEDWDRILCVVDAISNLNNRAVLRESIRSLRIRLEDPSSRVVILALILTESIVKNCGHFAHLEIGTESFLHQFELLYKFHHDKRGRESMEITERVLDLIQSWGEAFLPYRDEYPLFTEVYHNMRKKGIHFPKQYDETRVPVLTPQVYENNEERRNEFGHLSKREIYRLAVNVAEMLEDMVHEATKDDTIIITRTNRSDSSDEQDGIITEVALQARELVTRMENIIQRAVAEDDHEHLENYLKVNDELNIALAKYDSLRALQSIFEEENDTTTSNNQEEEHTEYQKSNQHGANKDNENDNDDDFAAFVRERANSRLDDKAPLDDDNNNNAQEEDPFAEFVQQRAIKLIGPHAKIPISCTKESKKEIDLWNVEEKIDDEQEQQQKETAASSSSLAQKNLWIDDEDDDNFVIASSSTSTSSTSTPTLGNNACALGSQSTVSKSSSWIDGMWDIEPSVKEFIPAIPRTTATTTIGSPITQRALSTNPFDDLLDSFEKTQIKTSNPFDTTPQAHADPTNTTTSSNVPIKSSNPFDF